MRNMCYFVTDAAIAATTGMQDDVRFYAPQLLSTASWQTSVDVTKAADAMLCALFPEPREAKTDIVTLACWPMLTDEDYAGGSHG